MKNVMLICNAGMSSSVMAKKTTKFLQEKGEDIQVDATTIASADKVFTSDKYDLILVSPQIRMKFDEFSKKAEKNNKNLAQVPFNAYAPIPSGVEAMANLVLENI
ncbi:MAG: PTS cellobiose transporter subunit IIB [Anaerococcus sp.]|uniref:PTS cellobiose transporter subunit IIB n=1 Tax=Anaerococcus sp. TaxID=1872515 RepID=UPI0026274CBD|nr:PTS cellobiose transporter subunit IIB [Anaerococcus sp.]MCI5971754.1 PTS cellobiose transporter subunit IIB [Anaerococcus sp.]MDY2927741.1 PTS cellobiose transporter subunit IIB [Anaerococcus sp.]